MGERGGWMAIGFYDFDPGLKPTKLFLNLEAMKLANYYTNKGQSVKLVDNLDDYDNFDKFYIFRNIMPKQTEKKINNKIRSR